MPEILTHEAILAKLRPYATSSWIKRFEAVKNKGQTFWLYVVRDFRIETPEIEMVVEDIVRKLDTKRYNKSLVRAEMAKLESEGKLKMDSPEAEAEWEAKLQAERDAQIKWEEEDRLARAKQREADIEHLSKKSAPDSPVPIKAQAEVVVNVIKAPEVKGRESLPLELSDVEKEQQNFIPKPPPEKELQSTGPVVKSISTEGGEVYNKEKSVAKPKLDTIKGLSKDVIERLNGIGINTAEDLAGMDKVQAKRILGDPLFNKLKDTFKS